ncbi:MAG: glutamate racemase [Oleispira sp.]|jgi:glutamate racemase
MPVKALIFDSGVGGFSVFKHIRQALPGLDTCYLMDNLLFPYGIQPDDILIERIVSLCKVACTVESIDVIVIACNTASTLALPSLRKVFDIPIIGVVPAIKTAAQQSQNRHIALLATPATIDRPYIDQLILDHAGNCKVERIGSSQLVELAEKFWLSERLDIEALKSTLLPWIESDGLDQIILGCTHFPLLSGEISKLYPHIGLIDSGHAIASRLCFILQQLGHDLTELQTPSTQHSLLVTADIANKASFLTACRRIAPYQSFNIIS